jgi:hypothetical protein
LTTTKNAFGPRVPPSTAREPFDDVKDDDDDFGQAAFLEETKNADLLFV